MTSSIRSPIIPNQRIVNGIIVAKIFDINRGLLSDVFMTDDSFCPNENYIVYYKTVKNYSAYMALKVMPDSELEIKKDILSVARIGIKGFFSEKTIAYHNKRVEIEDKWHVVKGLHIHHRYYQEEKLAWEYEALETLCWHCHEELHKNKRIPRLDKDGVKIGELTTCHRCGGAGYFPEFVHVESGECFHCRGKRFEELI